MPSATSNDAAADVAVAHVPWRLHCVAIVAYMVLTLALSWPLPVHLGTHLTGDPGGDTGVYVWNLWQFEREVAAQRNPLFTTALFVPTGPADLALHNYTVFADLLSVPLQPQLGLIATFNVIYLFLGVLNAYAMFLLARRAGANLAGAWLAGVLFAFSPFLTARGTAHFSLVAAAPLPLFLLCLLAIESTRKLRYAVGAGLALAWAMYCDPYYAVFCVLIALAWAAHAVVVVDRAPGRAASPWLLRAVDAALLVVTALVLWIGLSGGTDTRIAGVRIVLRSNTTPILVLTLLGLARMALGAPLRVRLGALPQGWLRPVAVAVLAASCALAPFLVALATVVAAGEFVSPPVHWRSSPRGVDALAFLMPNPNHRLLGEAGQAWLRRDRADGFEENTAAITFVAMAVVLVAFRRTGRSGVRRWFFFTLFFALLALGPFIWLGGMNTRVPTPWALLRYVPGIGMVRSPARFAVVAMIGVSVLFALAVTELWRRHPARRAALAALIFAALLFELAPLPRPLHPAAVPSVFHTIGGDPRDVSVLELPTGLRTGASSIGDASALTQFHQTVHGKPIVGGYLSRISEARVRACRQVPVLDLLFAASGGEEVSDQQRRRAFVNREDFLQRSRLGYVVIDTSRTSPQMQRMTTRLLGLRRVTQDGPYDLYVPDREQLAAWP